MWEKAAGWLLASSWVSPMGGGGVAWFRSQLLDAKIHADEDGEGAVGRRSQRGSGGEGVRRDDLRGWEGGGGRPVRRREGMGRRGGRGYLSARLERVGRRGGGTQ